MDYLQDPPFAVQIELTEGCNLRCPFCALNGIREPKKNDFKFMEPETLRSVLTQITKAGWNPRIEFAMHGEPTMHPDYVAMADIARQCAPKALLMMTSNGGGLLRAPGPLTNIVGLFTVGINILALDDYQNVNIVPKIRNAVVGKLNGVEIYEYPRDAAGNPHRRRPITTMMLTFVQDISLATKGTHSLINNHAGVGSPPNDRKAGKRCAKPFRELSVRWDGSVAICCNDWRGTYKCGNIVTDGLNKVWNGVAMKAARRKLYHGQRDFGPCKGCDAVSYRTGLLPDKFGKVDLPKPNAKVMKSIEQALAGEPYTKPVLRPWEKV